MVQLLYDDGGDINQLGNYGGTPILRAADNGHANVVEMLIGWRADVNKGNNDGLHRLWYQHIMGMYRWWKC